MPHAEFDDGFADHPKVWSLSDAAYRLHSSAILYCNRLTTDGFVPADKVPTLVPRYRPKTLAELVSHAIWAPVGLDGRIVSYELHDYLLWNPSRAQIEERRKKAAARKARWQQRKGDASDDED